MVPLESSKAQKTHAPLSSILGPLSWFRKRLSLALYNQFEHPEGTEVGGSDWEEVKEIYAEARASSPFVSRHVGGFFE